MTEDIVHKIQTAVKQALSLHMSDPNQAVNECLAKSAADNALNHEMIKRAVEAFNTLRFLSLQDRRTEYPVADAKEVLALSRGIDKASSISARLIPFEASMMEYAIDEEHDYMLGVNPVFEKAAAFIVEVEAPPTYSQDENEVVRQIQGEIKKAEYLADMANERADQNKNKFMGVMAKLAQRFSNTYAPSFRIFEKTALATYGDEVKPLISAISKVATSIDGRSNFVDKNAYYPPTEETELLGLALDFMGKQANARIISKDIRERVKEAQLSVTERYLPGSEVPDSDPFGLEKFSYTPPTERELAVRELEAKAKILQSSPGSRDIDIRRLGLERATQKAKQEEARAKREEAAARREQAASTRALTGQKSLDRDFKERESADKKRVERDLLTPKERQLSPRIQAQLLEKRRRELEGPWSERHPYQAWTLGAAGTTAKGIAKATKAVGLDLPLETAGLAARGLVGKPLSVMTAPFVGEGIAPRMMQQLFSEAKQRAQKESGPTISIDAPAEGMVESAKRQAVLQALMANDEILKYEDPNKVLTFYKLLQKFAPILSTDPEITKSFLRSAVESAGGLGPFELEALLKTERRARELMGGGKIRESVDVM